MAPQRKGPALAQQPALMQLIPLLIASPLAHRRRWRRYAGPGW
jgi:hypothetical protein